MRFLNILALYLSLLTIACQTNPKYGPPVVSPTAIEKDFTQWWTYYLNEINLAKSNFKSLDETGIPIEKSRLLEQLSTGNYIPIELNMPKGELYYQLFELSPEADPSIAKTISSQALKELKYYDQEGEPFPEFTFTDLNNQTYTSEDTQDKILVIKTWFIGCHACIAEFPELNQFVKQQEGRTDILFLSLATDPPGKLTAFLEKKPLAYATIGDQKSFLAQLGVYEYPTHFIVGRDGKIKKIVNTAHQLFDLLEPML